MRKTRLAVVDQSLDHKERKKLAKAESSINPQVPDVNRRGVLKNFMKSETLDHKNFPLN